MSDIQILLEPFYLNSSLTLNNRIVMAPMTRRQADQNGCVNDAIAVYYARRASAGLIISEGTIISEDAIGYGNVPGIYNAQQIQSWKLVTDKVHKQGGKIFLQLWHCGRVSHSHYHHSRPPISASAILLDEPLGNSGFHCERPRAASIDEIQKIIMDYSSAAENAMLAGFDGIELHGANGYLIDQFLHFCTNQRTDDYGQSPENMSRFCLEVVNACINKIRAECVAIRLSPGGHMAGIKTQPEDKAVFIYLLEALSKLNIAYVHTGQFDDSITYSALDNSAVSTFMRRYYQGDLIVCGGYDVRKAINAIKEHTADLVAIGRLLIANPDLIEKFKTNQSLIDYDKSMLASLI